MPPTQVCIVARLMSRTADRALCAASIALLLVASVGCQQLDGRNRNRKGNRYFQGMHFAAAVGEYEKAIAEVPDPTIDYNLGLAYSKLFRPGYEGAVKLDRVGSIACQVIPNVKTIEKQVCVKPDNWDFPPCDEKNVCASSFKCEHVQLCTADNKQLADLAAQHFEKWLAAHPDDDDTRAMMTQVWIDSSQYQRAIDYWEGLLKKKPNDAKIMGSLAGINLKADDWRKSIEWYLKVAEVSTDPAAKAGAYQFVGNVAWAKLSSKTLSRADSIELADKGIGALQMAAQIQPDNPKPVGLQASIYNFRSQQHGASWAGAIDRASAQDLQHASGVLYKAMQAKGQAASGAATSTTPNPAKAGG